MTKFSDDGYVSGHVAEPDPDYDHLGGWRVKWYGPVYDVIVLRDTEEKCVQAVQPVRGYCTQCMQVPPEHVTAGMCIPCFNAGHGYRLVNSEADRLWRIDLWGGHYAQFGFTREQVERLLERLVSPPEGWNQLLEKETS